ncbi:LysE family transporter [Streptomyces niveus]|uniref:LysE family transporter n=1 Tax=Streptomyces niveus TaxID=193462 RepID=UPI0003C5A417|nr:LysE family transporter [Streptomyces niveus]EST25474.1 hypothetical protein M877_22290 [Streptomyces niveus NCIMB 11891]
MRWQQVLGFVAAITPLTLIPGASFTLVTQRVIAGSRADGVLVALGSACGLLVHATFAAVGLSALVMSSGFRSWMSRVAGAVLVGFGIRTAVAAR